MDSFDQSLPMILNRALDAVMPPYRELFAQFDLTEQQWRILRVLWTHEKVVSVDLASRTLLATASLVGIIDRLEKKGLVARVRSTTDRRAVYITATAKGRKLEATVGPRVEAIQSRIRATVSDREWKAMEKTLLKVASALDDNDSGSPLIEHSLNNDAEKVRSVRR